MSQIASASKSKSFTFDRIVNISAILSALMLIGLCFSWVLNVQKVQTQNTSDISNIKEVIKVDKEDTSKKLDDLSRKQDQIYQFLLNNYRRK